MSYPTSIQSYVAKGAFAVTPAATVFANGVIARGLYIGGAGNVSVITQNGTTVVFSGVAAGQILPIAAAGVTITNTTATLILGLTN